MAATGLFNPNYQVYNAASQHFVPSAIGDVGQVVAAFIHYARGAGNHVTGRLSYDFESFLEFDIQNASADDDVLWLPNVPFGAYLERQGGLADPLRVEIDSIQNGRVVLLWTDPRGISLDGPTDQGFASWNSAGNRNLHGNAGESGRMTRLTLDGTMTGKLLLGGIELYEWVVSSEEQSVEFPVPIPTRWHNGSTYVDLRFDLSSFTSGTGSVNYVVGRP